MNARRGLGTGFAALFLMAIYPASYFLLLEPTVVLTESCGGIATGYREPAYKSGGSIAEKIFRPVAIVDQMWRPAYWDSWSSLEDQK